MNLSSTDEQFDDRLDTQQSIFIHPEHDNLESLEKELFGSAEKENINDDFYGSLEIPESTNPSIQQEIPTLPESSHSE